MSDEQRFFAAGVYWAMWMLLGWGTFAFIAIRKRARARKSK